MKLSYLLLTILGAGALTAATLADPSGDTYGVSPRQHDIVSWSAVSSGGSTVFHVNFADGILPPWDLDEALSVFGFISIDLDRNPSTGLPLTWDAQSAETATALSTEVVVHLFNFRLTGTNTGFVAGMDQRTWTPFDVPISFSGNGFVVDVPFTGIEGSHSLRYAMAFGNEWEAHDETPVAASTVVPEPGSLLLTGAGLLVSGWSVRRRHRGRGPRELKSNGRMCLRTRLEP